MRLHVCLLTALVLTAPLAAHADSFTFSGTTLGVTMSGTFTGTPDASIAGAYDITGITGEVNGIAITGLIPASYSPTNPTTIYPTGGSFTFDNLFYTSGPAFDVNGLLFQLSNSDDINLYQDGSNLDYLSDATWSDLYLTSFSVTPAPVPEPSSLALFGTGLLLLAGLASRRLVTPEASDKTTHQD